MLEHRKTISTGHVCSGLMASLLPERDIPLLLPGSDSREDVIRRMGGGVTDLQNLLQVHSQDHGQNSRREEGVRSKGEGMK